MYMSMKYFIIVSKMASGYTQLSGQDTFLETVETTSNTGCVLVA